MFKTVSPGGSRTFRNKILLQLPALVSERCAILKWVISPMGNNMSSIRAALQAAGVAFIPENGGGAGVRLRKTEASF